MTRSILQVAHYEAAYDGTFIAMLKAIGREGESRGYRPVFLLPEKVREWSWYCQLAASGQAIRFLPCTASLRQYTREIAKIAAEEDAAIIHTHFTTYDVAAWAAGRQLRRGGKKIGVVWHAHSEIRMRQTMLRRLKELVKYRMLGATVRAIACSEGVMGDLRTAGVPEKNIRLVINGIDFEQATAAHRPPDEVRAALGIPLDEQMLFMFAWAPHRKGLDVAIDAVETLVQEGYRLSLVPSGTEEMQKFIAERTKSKPLAWLRPIGKVPSVADLYQASSMFLCPSRSEGLAAAVLEALANRLPLVHSDIPAAQWARAVPNVVLCPPGDSAALAAAIRTVLAWPPDERERRTEEGLALVRQEYDVKVWAQRCYRVYEELL
jgi:glycosyltransferase involved in cell wall biosynthesis